MTMEINVHDYKVRLGKNINEADILKARLPIIIKNTFANQEEFKKINIYGMNGEEQDYNLDDTQRILNIFNNSNFKGAGIPYAADETTTICGVGEYVNFLPPKGDGLVIISPEGIPIAEYKKDKGIMCVLFDLLGKYDEDVIKIFEYIISEFNKKVILPQQTKYSWKLTDDKEELIQTFLKHLKQNRLEDIEADKAKLRDYEENIERYRRELKKWYDQSIWLRDSITNAEQKTGNVSSGIIKDLDNISNHPKIIDLSIKNNKLIVKTKPLVATNQKGEHFMVGAYTIDIIPNEVDITIITDTKRRSYWSRYDNHPHVNDLGKACFGNVDSTLAELCSQNELYAIVMVIIDFLESINIDDAAGRMCYSWDRCDSEGNITYKAEIEVMCDCCNELYLPSELNTAYDIRTDNGDLDGEVSVCDNCIGEYYEMDEHQNTWVRDM